MRTILNVTDLTGSRPMAMPCSRDLGFQNIRSGVRSGAAARLGACALAALLAMPAAAGYRAEVLSADPIVERYEVEVPHEVCRNEQVAYRRADVGYREDYRNDYRQQTRRSRTPTVVGAIIGGAIGHSVGRGKTNKHIGTAVGAVLGGTIGGDISRRNHAKYEDQRRAEYGYERDSRRSGGHPANVSYRTEQVCRVTHEYRTEERIRGYEVTYAYAGQTYNTVLDHDPGRYLEVNVRVTPAE